MRGFLIFESIFAYSTCTGQNRPPRVFFFDQGVGFFQLQLISVVIQKQEHHCAHRLAGSVSWSTHIVVRAAGGGCALSSESLPEVFCFWSLFLWKHASDEYSQLSPTENQRFDAAFKCSLFSVLVFAHTHLRASWCVPAPVGIFSIRFFRFHFTGKSFSTIAWSFPAQEFLSESGLASVSWCSNQCQVFWLLSRFLPTRLAQGSTDHYMSSLLTKA